MAAEKYRKPNFMTKPLSVPKPVHRKARTLPTATPSMSTDANKDDSLTQRTITKPATTQETQDAIDALLLLGTIGVPPALPVNPEDNEILMPIGGNSTINDDNSPTTNVATSTTASVNPPKVGTVLGVAIKNDTGDEPEDIQEQENKQTDNDDTNEENKDKTSADEETKTRVLKTTKRKHLLPNSGLKRRNRP